MATPTGLGKGLNALFRESNTEQNTNLPHTLPVKDITPNTGQPRKTFHESSLVELAASIKAHGLLQPIVVRPLEPRDLGKYEIVAGERRYRACKIAGLLEVPVVIKTFNGEETLAAALVENMQREDLNPLEEALAIQTLKDACGYSQEELAGKLGKSRSAIANSLRLLALPDWMHADLIHDLISAGHARALLSITEPNAQKELHRLILENNLSVREAEGLVIRWKETGTFQSNTDSDSLQPLTPPPAEQQRIPKKAQSAILLDAQEQLCSCLNAKIKVTGQESKGKITISYGSKEEFERLLLAFSALQSEAQV